MVEKEDRDLLVGSIADVDAAVNSVGRLVPVRLPGCDLESSALTAIPVFDRESLALQDDGHPMEWVAVPGHCLARREAQPANEGRSALEEWFLGHAPQSLADRTGKRRTTGS